MALEGASQLSEKSRTLYGSRFRDASFQRGLIVLSDEEGAVKTSLSFLPNKHVPGQYVFTIFSTTTTSISWTKCCHGTGLPEYTSELQSEVEESVVDMQWWEQRQRHQLLPNDDAAEFVDVDAFGDHLQRIGMDCGPLFRNVFSLQDIPSSKAS